MADGQGFIADLNFPWRSEFSVLLVDLNAQATIALHAVVGFDIANRLFDVAHYLGKVDLWLAGGHPEAVGSSYFMGGTGSANQRFGGHAAGVQTVAAHFMFFHQRHLGFYGTGDIAGDQPRRTAPNDHKVVVKVGGSGKTFICLALLHQQHNAPGDPGEDGQQQKRGDKRG